MKNIAGRIVSLLLQTFLIGSLWVADAQAQSIAGRLLDTESGQPITSADIVLLAADSVVGRTTSNAEGVFQLSAPAPGDYRLRAEHIAYQGATSEILKVGENERVVVDLRLSVAAIVLEAVAVVATAERRPGELGGFYDRQRRSPAGTFLTRESIEKLAARTTSQVLQFGGLQVRYDRFGDPIFHSGMRQSCMDIIIDGVRSRGGMALNVDDIVPPEFIEGIEIYKDAHSIPVPHGAPWSDCGAILIWTTYSR